ncbi:DUF6809 family protein, partial [uncultured Ruminococcus sp.]|uniref:DUF6809 family protein n=1 Tax=uncultured Ruminococcus sp. TaxID=165186 RepID=UPI00344D5E9D
LWPCRRLHKRHHRHKTGMCDTLEKRLSADDKKLLNEITDMQGILSETIVAESYIQGFRDCAELIIDVMFGSSENLK